MRSFKRECIVVGTGAAGYNAACRLKQQGVHVAIVTEGINVGTSRNTGSDKQTYYKLGLGGAEADSVHKMAQNLFDGGRTDGDNALCEAALSTRCFMNLCELGVPFPVNRYGEYVGYKTDHDPYARATSVGPLTSKFMTEALEKHAKALGVEIFDGYLAVEVLKKDGAVCGLLCLEQASGELVGFQCGDIVLATGGPAGIYADSVYPECHTGTSSLALLAGAKAQNLTLWQYGLASTHPRWNVSGTYMQVLPRFVSVDPDGTEHEFLLEAFPDPYQALSLVFLKGYQWPYDPRKAKDGSSQIDMLVYRECTQKKRRVYLDYTRNPFGLEEIEFSRLSAEAHAYLKGANATFGTPIQRLARMNTPAIELYRSKGVELEKEYLEIALCAQHNNGGIAVDAWWQTCVSGLYAAGECAGTHGISRPGGSALNAGQVGSLRAAQYVAKHPNVMAEDAVFAKILAERAEANHVCAQAAEDDLERCMAATQRRMSDSAAAVRDREKIAQALSQTQAELDALPEKAAVCGASRRYLYFKLRDVLVTQCAVLTAMLEDTRTDRDLVQETCLENGRFSCRWRPVRPIPEVDNFFENVWRGYRENQNIY